MKTKRIGVNHIRFHCPGCNSSHVIIIEGEGAWGWNGSLEQPTFTPSVLVWNSRPELRCHSFVTDGKIQFLSDCFHALAGQTVELPEVE